MCSHGPVHIANDSKVFVDGALEILRKLRLGLPDSTNWKLVGDGDLWEHFFLAAKAKGPLAINLTWVKGHATAQHVEEGITTEYHRKGNHMADANADVGVMLHGEDTHHVVRQLHRRHNRYIHFMVDVTRHLIEAYMIHRELLRIKEAKLTIDV